MILVLGTCQTTTTRGAFLQHTGPYSKRARNALRRASEGQPKSPSEEEKLYKTNSVCAEQERCQEKLLTTGQLLGPDPPPKEPHFYPCARFPEPAPKRRRQRMFILPRRARGAAWVLPAQIRDKVLPFYRPRHSRCSTRSLLCRVWIPRVPMEVPAGSRPPK